MEHRGLSVEEELVTTDQRQLDSQAVAITGDGMFDNFVAEARTEIFTPGSEPVNWSPGRERTLAFLPGRSPVEEDEDPGVLSGALSWSPLFPYKTHLFASQPVFLQINSFIGRVLLGGNLIIQPVITSKNHPG